MYVAAVDPKENEGRGIDNVHDIGKSLTLKQLAEVVQKMCLYISIHDPDSAAYAKSIDDYVDGTYGLNLDYSFQRRFGVTEDRKYFDQHRKWIEHVEKHILRPAYTNEGSNEDVTRHQHLLICLAYVGFSTVVSQFSAEPWIEPYPESYIFGLFIAIVRAVCGNEYGAEYDSRSPTYQIFRTTRTEDIGLDGLITSILLSSYYSDCGLNYTLAESTTSRLWDTDSSGYKKMLENNAVNIQTYGFIQRNVDDAARKHAMRDGDATMSGQTMEPTQDAGEEEIVRLTRELQEAYDEVDAEVDVALA